MRINTNILSLAASRSLSQTTKAIARSMERLASGNRVNSARDDAAGLSIANGLEAQRRGMSQALRNMNEAKGFLDTADGAMAIQTEILHRLRELALQSANGTHNDQERNLLNNEAQELLQEFNRLSEQTEYNGTKLLDGSKPSISLQVGNSKNDSISITLDSTHSTDALTESVTRGTGTFQTRVTIATGTNPFESVIEDFNDDGYLDIFTSSFGVNTFYRHFGSSSGVFSSAATSIIGWNNESLSAVDLNGDGILDILSSNRADQQVGFVLGNGNGTFGSQNTINSGSSLQWARAADMNGDGNADIVMAEGGSGTIGIAYGNGNGTFQSRVTIASGTQPYALELRDINNDGDMDIIDVDFSLGTVGINLGNGNGTFSSRITLASGTTPRMVLVEDLDDDGNLDVVSANEGSNYLNVYLGYGNGSFHSRLTMATGTAPKWVTASDLNGDEKLDLIQTDYSDGTIGIFLGNGDGTFASRKTISVGSNPFSVKAADLNEDGGDDLIVTNYGSGTISVLSASIITETVAPNIDISTQEGAEDSLELIDNGLSYIASSRSNIGALQSRLNHAASSAGILIENLAESHSQIQDADYALEMADFTRLKILQDAGLSVLTQANLSAQRALQLLRNISLS